mmetsp:Transcript_12320/g.31316  ORF Transcript_12320/g.31316 Transcript_12320/m.31316 type:complete len:215 (-) Transcript_12320:407-1051(-)
MMLFFFLCSAKCSTNVTMCECLLPKFPCHFFHNHVPTIHAATPRLTVLMRDAKLGCTNPFAAPAPANGLYLYAPENDLTLGRLSSISSKTSLISGVLCKVSPWRHRYRVQPSSSGKSSERLGFSVSTSNVHRPLLPPLDERRPFPRLNLWKLCSNGCRTPNGASCAASNMDGSHISAQIVSVKLLPLVCVLLSSKDLMIIFLDSTPMLCVDTLI